jgi:hypothetical protein
VVIGWKAGGLHHEHVLAADIFLDFNEHFHVVEALHHGLGLRQVEVGTDGFRQGPVAVTRHNFHHACPSSPRCVWALYNKGMTQAQMRPVESVKNPIPAPSC